MRPDLTCSCIVVKSPRRWMFQQKNGFRSCLVAAIFAIAALAAAPVYPAAADDATSVASHVPGTTDGVRPVHVIGREDIERSGMSTIHELLVSRSGYNNFGLYRPQLGATVVMIDGRRISGSNSTFVLQSLPVPAVERIEFISDGATALYANSPTGAINIVLRRGFEGATAWAGAERPAPEGRQNRECRRPVGRQGRARPSDDRRQRLPARRNPQQGPGLQPRLLDQRGVFRRHGRPQRGRQHALLHG